MGCLSATRARAPVPLPLRLCRARAAHMDHRATVQDITITDAQGQVTYVEVKTTTANAKPFVQISLPELIFAQRVGAAYHLYRVSNAGTSGASVVCLPDPISSIAAGQ